MQPRWHVRLQPDGRRVHLSGQGEVVVAAGDRSCPVGLWTTWRAAWDSTAAPPQNPAALLTQVSGWQCTIALWSTTRQAPRPKAMTIPLVHTAGHLVEDGHTPAQIAALPLLLVGEQVPAGCDHRALATIAALTHPGEVSVYSSPPVGEGPSVFLVVDQGRVVECASRYAALTVAAPERPADRWPHVTLTAISSPLAAVPA